MDFLIALLVVVALEIAAYLLMPKPKAPKPPAVQDLVAPTAEAGRPIPVVFGTIRITGTNVLWFGDVYKRTYSV